MSDHIIRDEKGRFDTIISMANIYEYGGFTFEIHRYCGPLKLNKDWQPAARMGRKFYSVYYEWHKLPDAEKLKTQISG